MDEARRHLREKRRSLVVAACVATLVIMAGVQYLSTRGPDDVGRTIPQKPPTPHVIPLSSAVAIQLNTRTDDLRGPIRTLRTEVALFINKSGTWVEGPHRLIFIYSYDVKGNRTETTYYSEDGSPGFQYKSVPAYDASGKLREIASLDTNSTHSSSKVVYLYDVRGNLVEGAFYENGKPTGAKETYIYDADGNLLERSYYDKGMSPIRRDAFEYARGKKTEERHYTGNNGIWRLEGTEKFFYDEQGHLNKKMFYAADGSHSITDGFAFDTSGRKTEEMTYNHDGTFVMKKVYSYDSGGNLAKIAIERSLPATYNPMLCQHGCPNDDVHIFEYDSTGNWIKEVVYGEAGAKPIQVTYRAISYYPEAKMP